MQQQVPRIINLVDKASNGIIHGWSSEQNISTQLCCQLREKQINTTLNNQTDINIFLLQEGGKLSTFETGSKIVKEVK